MCNGASTRITQGGSIAVLHPVHNFQRTSSSSSVSSSSCNSSDDEDEQQQKQEANEILLFFTNSLSKTSGTNVHVQGLHEQLKHQEGYIVIHRDGDLSSTSASQNNTVLCSFAIHRHARSWALERKLDLGVGDTGIIGRRVSVVTATSEMLAQGIVGWN